MTNKKDITLPQLKIIIATICERAEQLELSGEKIVPVRLDKDDRYYEHIEIALILSDDNSVISPSLARSLRISQLKIIDIEALGHIDITSPDLLINRLIFEKIELSYIEATRNSPTFMSLSIATKKFSHVELIDCCSKNKGLVTIHHDMHNGGAIGNAVISKKCSFGRFSIDTSNKEEVKNNSEKNEVVKSESPNEIKHRNLSVVCSHSTFNKLTLNLSKFININYNHGYTAKLVKGNSIQELIIEDEYPDVIAWGTREKIGEKIVKGYKAKVRSEKLKIYEDDTTPLERTWDKIENNKTVLMKFKKLAADKGDVFQESTINYHIAKCNEQLIYLENWKGFVQDKAVMFLGKTLSNHGTSWVWPLAWIILFNFVAGTIISHAINEPACQYIFKGCSFWYIFGDLFNPFSTPLSIAEGAMYKPWEGAYLLIAASVLLSKGFYAMCIYEFVRAARRFTLK